MDIETATLSAAADAVSSPAIAEPLLMVLPNFATGVPEHLVAVSAADSVAAASGDAAASGEPSAHKEPPTHDVAREALGKAQSIADSIRKERLSQAHKTFYVAIGILIVGIAIIFIGAGIAFANGNLGGGGITAAVGAIVNAISALAFKFNRDANQRLDQAQKDLFRIEQARTALSFSSYITDPEKRDEVIAHLIKEFSRDTQQ